MTGQGRFLIRMTLFLLAALGIAGALALPIVRAFEANPALNGLIFAVLLFGIVLAYRQVFQVTREIRWLDAWQRAAKSSASLPPRPPVLLAPMAKLLETRSRSGQISAPAMRSLLDSISARLDESRDLSRYLTGLLIFLGLLGTFWGLLQTVSAVANTIQNLDVSSGSTGVILEDLKAGLTEPLAERIVLDQADDRVGDCISIIDRSNQTCAGFFEQK